MESYAPQKALIFQRLYCFTSPRPFHTRIKHHLIIKQLPLLTWLVFTRSSGVSD